MSVDDNMPTKCLKEYEAYINVFSKEKAKDLLELGRKTYAIDTRT